MTTRPDTWADSTCPNNNNNNNNNNNKDNNNNKQIIGRSNKKYMLTDLEVT